MNINSTELYTILALIIGRSNFSKEIKFVCLTVLGYNLTRNLEVIFFFLFIVFLIILFQQLQIIRKLLLTRANILPRDDLLTLE